MQTLNLCSFLLMKLRSLSFVPALVHTIIVIVCTRAGTKEPQLIHDSIPYQVHSLRTYYTMYMYVWYLSLRIFDIRVAKSPPEQYSITIYNLLLALSIILKRRIMIIRSCNHNTIYFYLHVHLILSECRFSIHVHAEHEIIYMQSVYYNSTVSILIMYSVSILYGSCSSWPHKMFITVVQKIGII